MLLQYHFTCPFRVTTSDTSPGLSMAHQVALDYAIMKKKCLLSCSRRSGSFTVLHFISFVVSLHIFLYIPGYL